MKPPPEIPPELREPADQPDQPKRPANFKFTFGGDMTSMGQAWAIALAPVYGMIGFALIGWGVDALAGTFPWGILVGAVLGLVGGGYRFVKEALAMNRRGSSGGRSGAGKG